MTGNLVTTLAGGCERALIRAFFDFFADDPAAMPDDELEALALDYARPGSWHAVARVFATYAAEDVADNTARLARPLAMPVLAMGGSTNKTAVLSAMRKVARDVRGGVLERGGHWLAEEVPELVLREVLPFLAAETPRPPES